MPKSKKPRKKHTPKVVDFSQLSAKQQIKHIYGDKTPYCKVCNTETRLATEQELKDFKWYEPSYNLKFMWVPECECWEKEPEWMTL